MDLVPGRDCGRCTVCCKVPPVKSDDFHKQSGVLCEHCVETFGCGIHSQRPQVCREWFCGWWALAELDDGWRPDRSEILIVEELDDIPASYELRSGIKFVVNGPDECVINKKVISYFAKLAARKVPIFLSVPGPRGHFFAKCFVNDKIAGPVMWGDGHAVVLALQSMLTTLRSGEFEPVTFDDGAS